MEEERIEILYAKIIEGKSKDEMLKAFKNLPWGDISNREQREEYCKPYGS